MAFSFAQPCPASLLRFQYLLRFNKLRVSGSNLQFDTPHGVLDVELCPVVKRLCLLHFAFGEEAVEEVPTDPHACVPTGHVAAQVAEIALAFENRAVLFQRMVDALLEREWPSK